LCVITATAAAQEATWHLVFQPAFMRPDFAIPIAGTKETVLTPAIVRGDDVTVLKKAEAERLKLNMESIRRLATASARAELAKLTPEIVRDKRGVALFAVLASDSPTTGGAVLAPEFVEKFADVFGPDLLVAIPNRHRIYVYSALTTDFQSTASLVLRDYETSGSPVSKEVFRVTKDGLRAVGSFELQ
jgi:hypothetical protein